MIALTYQTLSVIIRSPVLNDTRKLNLGTVVKTAMDGTRWGYKRPLKNGPDGKPTQTLVFNFEYLGRSKINEIMAFKEQTVGKTITLQHYDNSIWFGILLNDPFESTQDRRRSSTTQLTFEGHRA
jgi:hypothetical protein